MIPFPIDRLWQMAAEMGVTVVWYPNEFYQRGNYCETVDGPYIFLNPAIKSSTMRYRCTFAHELGHRATGVWSGNPAKDDERANRWARKLLLPDWWLLPRIRWEPWEIAEEAGVYQEWVEARLRGLYVESRRMMVYV